jgi:dTMP kinase
MFISIEGGEGSGKTTLIKSLAEFLRSLGKEVILTREPGGTPFGEAIRHMLLDPNLPFSFGPRAEMLLFLAARAQHIEEVIIPALKQSKIVICDRFNDSTIAYQGGARGLGIDAVERLCNEACGHFHPDLTFVLDIDPVQAFNRIQRSKDRMEEETLEFHQKVRSAFQELHVRHPDRIRVIDAEQTPEQVLQDVSKNLSTMLL